MPEPKNDQNLDNQTTTDNQVNQNVDEKKQGGKEDSFEIIMKRLDAIEKAQQKTVSTPTPELKPENKKDTYTLEEVNQMLEKSKKDTLEGVKSLFEQNTASQKLEELMKQIPPEHLEKAQIIKEFYVSNPNEAIKQITERKLLTPVMLDYSTAISTGLMTREQLLAKVPLFENMGITEDNLKFSFKELVQMVGLRKFVDGVNAVDIAVKTIKEKFKFKN